MNVIGYLCYTLGLMTLISTTDAIHLQNDQNDQPVYDLLTADDLTRAKKPFCNAFTGCGKKRSFLPDRLAENEERSPDRIRVPVPIYRALLRAASREVRPTLERGSRGKDGGFEEYSYSEMNNKIPSVQRYDS
ncbi:uncharacterized protein CCAP [Venturia canescens]|uniref:uncharacterized protein CCAP n=1 Tax=Venturia canescens TaxID=32260 RepID=UPI001C9C8BD9|nr:uncharacterized protein LOC122415585 [Venturia canescens]